MMTDIDYRKGAWKMDYLVEKVNEYMQPLHILVYGQ